jgi:hypothetical protein
MENTNDLQTFWELTVKNEVPPNMILAISSTDIEGDLLSVTDKAYLKTIHHTAPFSEFCVMDS